MLRYGCLQHKDIAGPQIALEISNGIDPTSCRVEAIIDTGSTSTCLPERVIKEIGVYIYKYVPVRGVNGRATRMSCVVDVGFAGRRLSDVDVIVIDLEYALVGRDVINKFVTRFDGPCGEWSADDHIPH